MATRARLLHRARIAQVSGRVEGVVEAIYAIAQLNVELTQEEHNLLVSSYCQFIYPKLDSILGLLSMELEERDLSYQEETRTCRKSIQDQLESFYISAIHQLKSYLIPCSICPERIVFYHKLKGEFCWLLRELQSGGKRNLCFGNCLKAYEMAQELAEDNLPPANRARLMVAYKLSILYSCMSSCERSSEIAKEALVSIGTLSQDFCSDSMVLLELLKEVLIMSSVDFAIKTEMDELSNESAITAPTSSDKLVEQSSSVVTSFSTPYEHGPPTPVMRMAVPPADMDSFASPPSYMPPESAKEIRSRRKAQSCRRGHMG